MSGFRSPKSKAGAKAAGPGSTHQRTGKPRAHPGAKASGDHAFGVSTHEQLTDRVSTASGGRAKPGAKASQRGNNSLVVNDDRGFYHGTEHVTEHHRK